MHGLSILVRPRAQWCNVYRALAQTFQTASCLPQLSVPIPEGEEKPASPKLEKLVGDIAQLNLIEVSELTSLLKKRLNLPDTPMMPMGGFAPVAAQAEDDDDVVQQKVQTSFTVKLMKFDEKQKVALIKEIKTLLEGMNLVQAKKFVESAPAVVKTDIAKDEAEKLKEALSKVGATIEIE
uniref:Putative mitochondrial/ ribosomal protein l12 n=1 Tax=Xenopsylla cheopis TaxID=163159 RepID=A0A6M2DNU6_XENCH